MVNRLYIFKEQSIFVIYRHPETGGTCCSKLCKLLKLIYIPVIPFMRKALSKEQCNPSPMDQNFFHRSYFFTAGNVLI